MFSSLSVLASKYPCGFISVSSSLLCRAKTAPTKNFLCRRSFFFPFMDELDVNNAAQARGRPSTSLLHACPCLFQGFSPPPPEPNGTNLLDQVSLPDQEWKVTKDKAPNVPVPSWRSCPQVTRLYSASLSIISFQKC